MHDYFSHIFKGIVTLNSFDFLAILLEGLENDNAEYHYSITMKVLLKNIKGLSDPYCDIMVRRIIYHLQELYIICLYEVDHSSFMFSLNLIWLKLVDFVSNH
jgi:hypothetical protein